MKSKQLPPIEQTSSKVLSTKSSSMSIVEQKSSEFPCSGQLNNSFKIDPRILRILKPRDPFQTDCYITYLPQFT